MVSGVQTNPLRKSVHGKKSEAPKAPPTSFSSKLQVDRVPAGKKEGARQSSSRFRAQKKVELVKLANLKDVAPKDRTQLFIDKLKQCSALFDFTDALSDLKSKEIKRAALNELIDYLTNNKKVLYSFETQKGICLFKEGFFPSSLCSFEGCILSLLPSLPLVPSFLSLRRS